MIVGIPKEIKTHEYRVAVTPAGCRELVGRGHRVLIEAGCGAGASFYDDAYAAAGAEIVSSAADVFSAADIVVKVKEPLPAEYGMLRAGQTLFTYLHLAADPRQADGLKASGCTAIAYETITDAAGALPLLAPMSEIAGKLSIQIGARFLERAQGGSGVLLGGVPGVSPGKVAVLGAGVAGANAARVAMGIGAEVAIIDRSIPRLRAVDEWSGGRIRTLASSRSAVEMLVRDADLVIGAVLVAGASAPKLVGEELVKEMRRGSVLVDISIDQGGCFATSHPTTHDQPVYTTHGIVHYCVTNMPGTVARTATLALTNVTLPFLLSLAEKGPRNALREDPHLQAGLNVHQGRITHPRVAADLSEVYCDPVKAIAA